MVVSIISVLIAWTFGIITIISNSRSKQNIWLAIMMFTASTLGIGYVVIEISKGFNGSFADEIDKAGTILVLLSYYAYYPFLNFTFYSSGFFKENKFIMRYFPVFTFIPTILVSFTNPLSESYTSEVIPLMIWKNTYVLIGTIFLTLALYKNRRNGEMSNHLKAFVFIVPTAIILFIMNDLAYYLGHYEMYKYDSYVVIYLVIVFCIFTIKDGYLGMHIRLERTKMIGSVETQNMATSFITHDFKNEIIKIFEFTDKIKNIYPDCAEKAESEKWFTLIDGSKIKIQEMLKKIKSSATDGIVLDINKYNLKEIVEEALNLSSYVVNENNLAVNVSENMFVNCDFNNTARVFSNIIDNAYEAELENPRIKIYSYDSGRYICTVVQDDGRGIPEENLKFVIKPFFSTKTLKYNLGLGLAYCYDIISLSKGKLVIKSKEEKGTRVFVYLRK